MMHGSDIRSWCESVSHCSRKRGFSETHDASDAVHVKRVRREQFPSANAPAPAPAPAPSILLPQLHQVAVPPPRKRGHGGTPEPVLESEADQDLEYTPRPTTSASSLYTRGISVVQSTPSSVISKSSKSSKVSRNSSPRKQLRNAKLQPTGFRIRNFGHNTPLPSLKQLLKDLNSIRLGEGIIPESLRVELQSEDNIPSNAYSTSEATLYRYPTIERVRRIFSRAEICDVGCHGESSWNMDVHGEILKCIFRDEAENHSSLDFRYCVNAGIIPEYKSKDMPSKMIDFCLTIRVGQDEQRFINSLCKDRPGQSINHTDWGDLVELPVAISMETKDQDKPRAALIQLATWHTAQWRSLQWVGPTPSIEFLAGIIVAEHDWEFVATVLDDDGVPATLKSVSLGNTNSLFGIYTLFAALQRLQRWAESTYWPAFKGDVLGM